MKKGFNRNDYVRVTHMIKGNWIECNVISRSPNVTNDPFKVTCPLCLKKVKQTVWMPK